MFSVQCEDTAIQFEMFIRQAICDFIIINRVKRKCCIVPRRQYMQVHGGLCAVGTVSAFISVRIGKVTTAVRQQACSYATVDGVVLCFSQNLIPEHVYSEHRSRFSPIRSTPQRLWRFHCVVVRKF